MALVWAKGNASLLLCKVTGGRLDTTSDQYIEEMTTIASEDKYTGQKYRRMCHQYMTCDGLKIA